MSFSEVACACPKCQRMCQSSVCLPTPAEAVKLIERGYATRLQRYAFDGRRFVGPKPQSAKHLPKVLHSTRMGRCTFHTSDGRCELHDLGLKPYEGRIASHDRNWVPVRVALMQQWREPFDYGYVESRLYDAGGA